MVLFFTADWVEQCKHMTGVIEEMAKLEEYKDVRFAKLNAEQVPEISLKYEITSVPTFILLRGGEKVDRVDGANPELLCNKIKAQIGVRVTPLAEAANKPTPIDLHTRLETLINTSPVMLFMKGSAVEPRCGFSRQMIEILNKHNIQYKTFDILTDSDVREGLKTYSNWPTYPQLYVNGSLIGGIDIVKELEGSGELVNILPANNLEERLQKLINQSKIMVFMKGDADNPRCGFSRQLMEILKNEGLPFETFDILKDETVRQGLKEYSKWPTYPQVYVSGELVGGLDIIKEHLQSGELKSVLTGK